MQMGGSMLDRTGLRMHGVLAALVLVVSMSNLGAPSVYAATINVALNAPVDGMTMAMPIATDVLRARLDLPTGPTPVAEYTRSLRQRLDRLSGQAELAAPAPGGGGGQPSSGSPLSGLALATLLLPLGLLVLSAIVPIRELPRHLTRRGHRG